MMSKQDKFLALAAIATVLVGGYMWYDSRKPKSKALPTAAGLTPSTQYHDQDQIVIDMMNEINANYDMMKSPDDFQNNIGKLHDASQPTVLGTVACFVAPCPQALAIQCSKPVEDAAKALIDKMTADNTIMNGTLWGAGGGK